MEILIGLVVATVIILMVGALSKVAFKSYSDLRKRADVYNDAQFALNLIRESVRQSTAAPTYTSNCLKIVTTASGTNYFYISGTSLVYSGTCGSATNKPTISGVTNLVFTPDVSALPLVKVALSGTKNGATFNFTNGTSDNRMKVLRRNP